MILKTVTYFSAYWYKINQGIQIHGKWFNQNKLSNQAKP